VNCAETIQDGPGQPAYEMFGIKRRIQRLRFDPLGSRSPPYECIKFGYPLENVRFLLLSIAREWLQIDTDWLAAYHNKHWQAFREYQHRWPWTTLNPRNMGFKWFFAILGCDAHLEWIFAEIYWRYRPRQPAYEIKLMLSPVSWALAQISCLSFLCLFFLFLPKFI